jgi:flagellar basal-body rod protein FlgC
MKKIHNLLLMIFAFASLSVMAEDSLRQSIKIAESGAKFQSERLKVVAENIANQDSTSDRPGGDAYRRKVIFAKKIYDKQYKTNIVATKKVTNDNSDFILKYDPSHPAANEEGYIKYPAVHIEIESADMAESQRSFEANVTTMEMSNTLIQKTLDAIGR